MLEIFARKIWLKKMATALLSVFGSTYLREQIFSLIKFILISHRRRLTEDARIGYVWMQMLMKQSPNGIAEVNEVCLLSTILKSFKFLQR